MKLSIHRGLSELKMLDKRIERAMNEKFIGSKKKSTDKVLNSTLEKTKFEDEVKSNLQSVEDLIKRKTLIKKAIVLSNANTKVEIGGNTYTVAEAIENKQIIVYKKDLLQKLKKQYNENNAFVNRQNEIVEENLNEQIQTLLGSDKNNKSNDLTGFIDQYKAQNEWELVDGLGIEKVIKDLEIEIEEFENNVDYVLSESNATTFIEIDN